MESSIGGANLLMNTKRASSSRSGSVIDIASVKAGSSKHSRRHRSPLDSEDESLDSISVANEKRVGSIHRSMHSMHSGRSGHSKSERGKKDKDNKRAHSRSSLYSDDSSSIISSSDGSSSISLSSVGEEKRMSQEDIVNLKRELLYKLDRFERKGIKVPRKFTMSSSLEEMKAEYDRIRMDRSLESSIRWQREILNMFSSGAEWVSKTWNPMGVKLKGYNDKVMEHVDDFDEIFEELHYKYQGKAKFPPELRLVFTLVSSAITLHISNSLLGHLPGMDEVMRQNPQLREQVTGATLRTMANESARQQTEAMSGQGHGGQGSGGLNLMSMLGPVMSMFMGGGSIPPPPQQGPPPHASMPMPSNAAGMQQPHPSTRQMRGPSDINEILRQMKEPPMAGRMDAVSTISESDISEIPDDASVSGMFVTQKKKKGGSKRTLNL